MLDKLQLTEYKQAIAESYDRRSHSYDDSDWHLQVCSQLLIYSQIESEQCVLDIGTGTGHLAIGVAKIVGEKGRVIGIDISPEMLKIAQLITAKAEFEAELEILQTDQGIWNDLTTLYILGRKQRL